MTGFSAVPLADEAQDDHDRRWAGVTRVVGPAWAQLPSLTVGLFGVQVLWSVEMSYAPPYLLSLGLRKSFVAIVLLAGPLSGLIVQPAIGILADNSKSRFGRRRPFILMSTILCALATLLLGFARPVASIFTTPYSPSNDTFTIWLAVLSIYCIDFCINAVQALDRALLVDILPTTKQPAGNAWAASMLAIGSVAGFFVGNLDLPHFFPFIGTTQLEVLTVMAAFLLLLSQAWVCFHVKERILLSSSSGPKSFRQELEALRETLVGLPSVIRQICWIQFFAWLGWFPVLFYSTVYIGDLHKRSPSISQTQDAATTLDAESTRLATRALFYSALVSLAANIIMPSFVDRRQPRHAHTASPLKPKWRTCLERVGVRIHLCSLWAFSHLIFATCMAATFVTSTVSGATWIVAIVGFCWAITQWAPFALLGEAILSHPASDNTSIHLADTRPTRLRMSSDERDADADETRLLFGADEGEQESEDALAPKYSFERDRDHDESDPAGIVGLGHARARVSRVDVSWPSSPIFGEEAAHPIVNANTTTPSLSFAPTSRTEGGNGLSAQAGAIIGIHNVFVVIPQFLVSGLSSIIFAFLDPDKSSMLHGRPPGSASPLRPPSESDAGVGAGMARGLADGDGTETNSIAVIFRLGGIAAAIAFVLCYRLAKDLKRH